MNVYERTILDLVQNLNDYFNPQNPMLGKNYKWTQHDIPWL